MEMKKVLKWYALNWMSFQASESCAQSYHWGSCHKYHFCHDKSFVTTNICHDKCVCHNKSFVPTSILLLQQKMCYVETNTCLSQQNFCWNKKWYLSQLLPMIVLLLTKLMAQTRDKWWHRPELVDLSFKICGVSNVDKETQECMISILSIVL